MKKGFFISAHDLKNLLNEFKKRDKMRGLLSILALFATSLINSIKISIDVRFYLSHT